MDRADPKFVAQQAAMLKEFARQPDQCHWQKQRRKPLRRLLPTIRTSECMLPPTRKSDSTLPTIRRSDSKQHNASRCPIIKRFGVTMRYRHRCLRRGIFQGRSTLLRHKKAHRLAQFQRKLYCLLNKNMRPKTGVVEMYLGTYAHIHSTRSAWDAIANGEAIIVRCSVYRKRFQIA
jgi:hypothetical protein